MKNIISIFILILFQIPTITNAQSIEIESNNINSILKTSTFDEFKRTEIAKNWKKFMSEYKYPELPYDSTTNVLSFIKTIAFDSTDAKTIYNRCEQ